MNYEESVRAVLALGREMAAPQQARAAKFDLANIRTLAEFLGNPQQKIPCAHIAGTNGKGSTAAMLDSILRAAGMRTGLYTSPHLERINERIRIGGEEIADEEFAASWTRVSKTIDELLARGSLRAHPSFFECVTAMAFDAFARSGVDFAIYEVGLGGRLDATNIVTPEVAVITPVDFDHESYLGHSIEEIAGEKAGIIKPAITVVSAPQRSAAAATIEKRAKEVGAPIVDAQDAWVIDEPSFEGGLYRTVASERETSERGTGERITLRPALAGRFQLVNALTAATAARVLAKRGFPVTNAAIAQGIQDVKWPGRLEKLSTNPDLYLDGTHNPAGARELAKFWQENFRGRRIWLVYGVMRDKSVDEIAGLLFPVAHRVILTQPQQPRAVSPSTLKEMTSHLAKDALVANDPADAIEQALDLASPNDALFATGSLFLVGDLLRYWKSDRRMHNALARQER
jgi:dihydrofolate synthase / folylpolyglutamate synthase